MTESASQDTTVAELQLAILELLGQRAPSSTICPSEAARALGEDGWRNRVGPAREAARHLVAAGEVEITQGGKVVDLAQATGPIRIRRVARTSPVSRRDVSPP